MKSEKMIFEGFNGSFTNCKDKIYTTMKAALDIIEMTYKNNESCLIIKENNTDDNGSYDSMTIHVFEDFFDANDFLNSAMYNGKAIEVYQFNIKKNSYVNIMSKYHDSTNYTRLAMIKEYELFNENALRVARLLYDIDTKVLVYTK